ncbi:CocE/NonD family hydrolase [Sphingomonas sp.]|uniref:CocE/NonD family hydrolase n=1 Tax=Sphingomonas sp. TaxID=28214 RepID=UPI0025CE32B8|nr:CocE/NonD family hydrolase [Sphingomonas sp.]
MAVLSPAAAAPPRGEDGTAAASAYEGADRARVALDWKVDVPMRDQVALAATLYRPKAGAADGCIVAITPYTRDKLTRFGQWFAAKGWAFLAVDARGRGDSQGQFRPFLQEARDGYDVVEWMGARAECARGVVMWGNSYLGYAQWAAARERPPHLKAIAPAAAPMMGYDFIMRGGVRTPYLMRWLVNTAGHASQANLFGDLDFWARHYRDYFISGMRFEDFDQAVGLPSPTFREWISHPSLDAYWDAYSPTADQYRRIDIPALTITGMYDDCQTGALRYYREHERLGSAVGRAGQFLVIGPWDHRGTSVPHLDIGGVAAGPRAMLALDQLHLDWYRWALGEGPRPAFLERRVAYYVLGADQWRYADTLDAVTAANVPLFLGSTANATAIDGSGTLGAAAANGPPDHYRYDPNDPNGPEIDAEFKADGGSFVDEPLPIALQGRELVYQTRAFAADVDLAGFFRLKAWLQIDRPDTDIYVSVYDVSPEGRTVRLSNDLVRARYRQSLRTPTLLRPDEIALFDFNRFTFAAARIAKGHRLRLVIAPMGRYDGNTGITFAEKNYGSGGDVARESASDGRPVTVKLYHDRQRPSFLSLPVNRDADRAALAAEGR